MIRVHVVHDHPVVRDSLSQSLGRERDIVVVGVSPDGAAGAEAVRRSRSDVIVLTPSWREPPAVWVGRYRDVAPAARIVLLQPASGEDGSEVAGADAAVITGGLVELLASIRCVAQPGRIGQA